MKIKQTVKALVFALVMTFSFVAIANPAPVLAECPPGTTTCCGGVATSIISCTQTGNAGGDNTVENTGVWGILLLAVNILTAGIGVVAVAGIVYASILYTSAGGSAEQTKKAMTIIADIVIGILAYALMYAVLNFLVPGGLFN